MSASFSSPTDQKIMSGITEKNAKPRPTAVELEPGQKFVISDLQKVELGLQWDIFSDVKVDLDASCAVFNDSGALVDCVYYNQLKVLDGAIQHFGDNKHGTGDGDDERISIDLPNLPDNVTALMVSINCFSKRTNFDHVDRTRATLRNAKGNPIVHIPVTKCKGKHTGIVLCRIARATTTTTTTTTSKTWELTCICETVENGRTFMDMLPRLVTHLQDLIDPKKFEALKKVPLKNFNMKKGQYVLIPDILEEVKLGLGWDVNGGDATNIDLDASAVIYDKDRRHVDQVYYGQKVSSGAGYIQHSGDNMTGRGDGDDEVITVNLPGISTENVYTIIFVVNIYTKNANFSQVNNAYVRLFTEDFELCRYTLSSGVSSSINEPGLIMCKLYRDIDEAENEKDEATHGKSKSVKTTTTTTTTTDAPVRWKMQAIGVYSDGNKYTTMLPVIQEYVDNEIVEEVHNGRSRSFSMSLTTGTTNRTTSFVVGKVYSAVEITLHEGQNLPALDLNGLSDPYCKVRLNGFPTKFKTQIQKKTLDPVWNETFRFDINRAIKKDDFIKVKVLDYDFLRWPDHAGDVLIALKDGPCEKKWFPLWGKNSQGKICISVRFIKDNNNK